jgi:hypothetical protein
MLSLTERQAEAILSVSLSMGRTVVAAALVGCLWSAPALAQGQYTAEELRDLGRPVTPGASTLALGGTRGSGLGDATDATFNPAALVVGPRADAVVSVGGSRYGRKELERTLSGVDFTDRLVPVVGGLKPIGSAAVAFRTPRVGVGITYDAVSRLDYARDVDRLRWASWVQRLIDERQWSLEVQHQRLGAGVGVVLPGHLASVGVALHAARTRIRYDGRGSNSELYTTSTGQFFIDSTADTEAHLDADTWNLGMTVGAMMQPHPRVDVGVRYVREPKAGVDLRDWWARRDRRNQLEATTQAFVDPPDVVSGGATVRVGALRVVGEAGAVLAARTFHDAIATTPNNCQATPLPTEPGFQGSRYSYPCWRLYTAPSVSPGAGPVAMSNGADVRLGAERGWHTASVSWWLRGGVSREASAVLQTLPPIDNGFVPPEHARTWLHAGGGFRLGRTITDIGFARWQQQYRVLIDVRLSTSTPARTVYGSRR